MIKIKIKMKINIRVKYVDLAYIIIWNIFTVDI